MKVVSLLWGRRRRVGSWRAVFVVSIFQNAYSACRPPVLPLYAINSPTQLKKILAGIILNMTPKFQLNHCCSLYFSKQGKNHSNRHRVIKSFGWVDVVVLGVGRGHLLYPSAATYTGKFVFCLQSSPIMIMN